MTMPVGKKNRGVAGCAVSGPKGGGSSVGGAGKLQAQSRLEQRAATRCMEGQRTPAAAVFGGAVLFISRTLWSARPLGSSTFYLQLAEVRQRGEQLVQAAQQREAVVAHAVVLVHDQHRVEERVDRGAQLGEHRVGGEEVLRLERLAHLLAALLQRAGQRRFRRLVAAQRGR